MRLRQWLWRGKLLLWQLSMASGWELFLPGSCSIEQWESIHANDLRLGVYMLNWSTSSASPWEYLFLNMSILMALRQPSFHIWSLQIFSKPCCQWSFPGCFLVVAQHQMLKLEECLNRFGLATRRSTPNRLFFNTQSDWAKPFLWPCMWMVATTWNIFSAARLGSGHCFSQDGHVPLWDLSCLWWWRLVWPSFTTSQQQAFDVSDTLFGVCISIQGLLRVSEHLDWVTERSHGQLCICVWERDCHSIWGYVVPSLCWFQTWYGMDGEGGFADKILSKCWACEPETLLPWVWCGKTTHPIWRRDWLRMLDTDKMGNCAMANHASLGIYSVWFWQTRQDFEAGCFPCVSIENLPQLYWQHCAPFDLHGLCLALLGGHTANQNMHTCPQKSWEWSIGACEF